MRRVDVTQISFPKYRLDAPATCRRCLLTCLRSETIDEARPVSNVTAARSTDYGLRLGLRSAGNRWYIAHTLTRLPHATSMTRVGEGRTHDTAWLAATDASTVSIPRRADTYIHNVRAYAPYTIDFSHSCLTTGHTCARVYVEPRVSKVVAQSNSVTIYTLMRTFS